MKKTNLKKAFIDQILLVSVLVAMTMTFVATVSDEYKARSKFYTLDKLTVNLAKGIAKHYIAQPENQKDMQSSEDISDALLTRNKLGRELLASNDIDLDLDIDLEEELDEENEEVNEIVLKPSISYIWRDSNGDGSPNSITVKITNYSERNFWYRLIGKDSFTLEDAQASVSLDTEIGSKVFSYRHNEEDNIASNWEPNGYTQDGMVIRTGSGLVVGSYELDGDGLATNASAMMVHCPKVRWSDRQRARRKGTELNCDDYGNPKDGDYIGTLYGEQKLFLSLLKSGQKRSNVIEDDFEIDCPTGDCTQRTLMKIDGEENVSSFYQDNEDFQSGGYKDRNQILTIGLNHYEEFVEWQTVKEQEIISEYNDKFNRCYSNGKCKSKVRSDEMQEKKKLFMTWKGIQKNDEIDISVSNSDDYVILFEDWVDNDYNDIKLNMTMTQSAQSQLIKTSSINDPDGDGVVDNDDEIMEVN